MRDQKKDGTPVNLSISSLTSVYPSAVIGSTGLNVLWSETTGDPNAWLTPCISNLTSSTIPYEGKLAFYAVGTGTTEPSSYTISRDGYITYTSGIAVDYSATELTYSLPYLDPDYAYTLQIVGFYEATTKGSGKWNEQIKLDGKEARVLKVNNAVPETLTIDIPAGYYQEDGQVTLAVKKLTGDYASVANITLYQNEPVAKTAKLGGAQMAEETTDRVQAITFNLQPSCPNPARQSAVISYQIPKSGMVALKVYNLQGQLVKTLVNETKSSGMHNVAWNLKNDNGQQVSNGIYIYKLDSGVYTATKKITVLK